jgi:chromosome segregation ATPase
MEHEERAEELEEEAEKLDEHSDEVGEQIDEARREWEAKQDDPTVPGAQPPPGEEEESIPGVAADEDILSEEGGP